VIQGLNDEDFGFGVKGAGGFVKDEDGRVLEEGAGDGKALAFATERVAPRSPMMV